MVEKKRHFYMNKEIDKLYFETREIEDYVDKEKVRKTIDYNSFVFCKLFENIFKEIISKFK